jgi:hypothetical protein
MKKLLLGFMLLTSVSAFASETNPCSIRIDGGRGMCHNLLSKLDMNRISRIMSRKGYEVNENENIPTSFELRVKTSVDCGKDILPRTTREKIQFYLVHDENFSVEMKGPQTDIFEQDDRNLTSYGIGLGLLAKHGLMKTVRQLPNCNP